MPEETIRDRSAVGRFPSVTLGILNDVGGAEEAEPEESKTQNRCRQWLRKLCPCCQPKPEHDDVDALVTANDGDHEEGEATAEKPETGDSELGGTRSPLPQLLKQTLATHSTSLSCFHRSPPQSAICGPDEEQGGAEPEQAPHPPLPD